MILTLGPNGGQSGTTTTPMVSTVTANPPKKPGFTLVGIITLAIVFWIAAQNAQGSTRSFMNLFLFVLLVSMLLLNWRLYGPIFFN